MRRPAVEPSPRASSASRWAWALTAIRWSGGIVFVVFGTGKFIDHGSETASFQSYGLPWPSLFADVIGVLELVGGTLLILGLGTRAIALLLAGDMIGAIVVSGLLRGETISLTLAPGLLIATVTLALRGPGLVSLDAGRADRPPRGQRRSSDQRG